MMVRAGKKLAKKTIEQWSGYRNRRFLSSLDLSSGPCRPIFLIGPPRCGSTLFYQAMTHCFQFCYFSNEMMKNSHAVPMNVQKHNYSLEYQSDFSSSLGRTEGETAPHEAWPFWRRFYPRVEHDYIGRADFLNNEQENEIVQTVKFMESYYNHPFITKNIESSMRLRSLYNIFPEALCIVLKRDPRATAASILEGRRKLYGDPHKWLGVRPPAYPILKNQSVMEQVLGQILGVYEMFYQDAVGNPFFEVYYEDFCNEPMHVMSLIKEFLLNSGCVLGETGRQLPPKFSYKGLADIALPDQKLVHELLDKSPVFKARLSYQLGN